jgi:predicted GNAT family N-acyltransferase
MIDTTYTIELATWDADRDAIKTVREDVFIREQAVPPEDEWDELDAKSVHALARDAQGAPIGTGRLTPEHTIGRMAVLKDWRGKDVGAAILRTLLEQARAKRYPEITLHAQTHAIPFYERSGFAAYGDEYLECGIPHRHMRLRLEAPEPVERAVDRDDARHKPPAPAAMVADGLESALACIERVVGAARHKLWVYTRDLEPGLTDRDAFLEHIKRIALSGRGADIRILVQEPANAVRDGHRLLHLAARLPTFVQFRTPTIEEDKHYPAAFVLNDQGGYFFRPIATRYEGEGDAHAPGRHGQLLDYFGRVWDHSELDPSMRRLLL